MGHFPFPFICFQLLMHAILIQHSKQNRRPHSLFAVDLEKSTAMIDPVAVVVDVTLPPIQLVKCHRLIIQRK